MGGDSEGQAGVHAAAVLLDRRVEEALDLAEGDDLVELGPHLGPRHAEDRAVEVDVLPAGKLGVEAGADFQQAADAAVEFDVAGRGLGDAGKDLEQRALARAVSADDADDFALFDLEADVLQGPEAVVVGEALAVAQSLHRPPYEAAEGVAQGLVLEHAPRSGTDAVLLADALDADGGVRHRFAGASGPRVRVAGYSVIRYEHNVDLGDSAVTRAVVEADKVVGLPAVFTHEADEVAHLAAVLPAEEAGFHDDGVGAVEDAAHSVEDINFGPLNVDLHNEWSLALVFKAEIIQSPKGHGRLLYLGFGWGWHPGGMNAGASLGPAPDVERNR